MTNQYIPRNSPMVVAAARALCKLNSDICGVDNEDNWKLYSELFLADASIALDAAEAPEMLKALQRLTHPAADDEDLAYALEVIAKATGGQS